MAPGAQIGFHAAFNAESGQESGVGNALVGAYLRGIGLPYKAVAYIATAPPNSMTWLSLADAKQYGIDVTPLEVPDSFYVTQALAQLDGSKIIEPPRVQTVPIKPIPGMTVLVEPPWPPLRFEPPAPSKPPYAPEKPSPEAVRPVQTVQDLHLRAQPDPNAPDAISDPAPNDVMPKGAVVRVNVNGCTTRTGSASGPQKVPIDIWCPVSYRNYDGWANAYYLATDDGLRLACVVNSAAQACGAGKYAQGPSFDCAKGGAPDEVTICNSDTLSVLDRQMADLFTRVRDGLGSAQQLRLGEEQRVWLGHRAACQKDERCIVDAYRSRLAQLRDRLAELTPGERGTTSPIPQAPFPNKPPELKPSERWALIASRGELQDAISIAQDYKSDYPGTLVVQSQNGQFAVIIGPIDVQQNPSFLTQLAESNKIPEDTYYSAGTRFVAVVWPGTALGPSAPVQKPFTLRDLLPIEK
jgi:uncharacterized protein